MHLKNHFKIEGLSIPKSKFSTLRASDKTPTGGSPLKGEASQHTVHEQEHKKNSAYHVQDQLKMSRHISLTCKQMQMHNMSCLHITNKPEKDKCGSTTLGAHDQQRLLETYHSQTYFYSYHVSHIKLTSHTQLCN